MHKSIVSIVEMFGGGVYIVLKFTGILEMIIPCFFRLPIIFPCIYQEISAGIVRRRWANSCAMSVDVSILKKIQEDDYFKNHIRITKNIINVFLSINNNINLHNEILKTETNEIMMKMLVKQSTKMQNVSVDASYKFDCWQPIEKLFLINPRVLRENIFTFQLWRTLFRKEKIYDVEIRFNKI